MIDCNLPSRFYDYSTQNSKEHSKADKVPALASSCKSGATVDDAITASAKLLWHIERRSDPAIVISYLRSRVLGGS
ncbi:hypothetical protein ASE00_08275 [Sphingomonas sp. Root710]|nr:hypothetical protein ASE00_08275 [Sphingomonas sp. Root710]